MPKTKELTPDQRVTNAPWLREQIQKLIQDCDDNIKEDTEMMNLATSPEMSKYEARVESHQHWKRNLERILRGKTFVEDLAEGIKRGARRG